LHKEGKGQDPEEQRAAEHQKPLEALPKAWDIFLQAAAPLVMC